MTLQKISRKIDFVGSLLVVVATTLLILAITWGGNQYAVSSLLLTSFTHLRCLTGLNVAFISQWDSTLIVLLFVFGGIGYIALMVSFPSFSLQT